MSDTPLDSTGGNRRNPRPALNIAALRLLVEPVPEGWQNLPPLDQLDDYRTGEQMMVTDDEWWALFEDFRDRWQSNRGLAAGFAMDELDGPVDPEAAIAQQVEIANRLGIDPPERSGLLEYLLELATEIRNPDDGCAPQENKPDPTCKRANYCESPDTDAERFSISVEIVESGLDDEHMEIGYDPTKWTNHVFWDDVVSTWAFDGIPVSTGGTLSVGTFSETVALSDEGTYGPVHLGVVRHRRPLGFTTTYWLIRDDGRSETPLKIDEGIFAVTRTCETKVDDQFARVEMLKRLGPWEADVIEPILVEGICGVWSDSIRELLEL